MNDMMEEFRYFLIENKEKFEIKNLGFNEKDNTLFIYLKNGIDNLDEMIKNSSMNYERKDIRCFLNHDDNNNDLINVCIFFYEDKNDISSTMYIEQQFNGWELANDKIWNKIDDLNKKRIISSLSIKLHNIKDGDNMKDRLIY